MIIHGDCLEEMRKMEDSSIDFIVTDPPYFLTNNSGSGFMGKTWDSIHGLSKYLWESNTFANSAIKVLNDLLLDHCMEEENHVQKNVNTLLSEKTENLIREYLKSVQFAIYDLKHICAQKKDSVLLLVLTKPEVLDLLKESCQIHIKIVDKFLNGVKENALFVIPITLLARELSNTVHKNVLPKITVKDIEGKEIHLSSTDQVALKNVIEEMIGTKYVEQSMNEISGSANTVSSIADRNKFNVITLSHIDREDLTTWITSLLCAINAIRKSSTAHNYLIENFYKQIFKQSIRICKPGAMVAVFGGTRTVHRLTCAIEDAGFEIRDVCMYLYGSGFPKSHNFGRKLDEQWHSFGTALKPAYEPIIICMKPCDGTFAHNAEKWGVAGINIDDSRIGVNPGYSYPNGKGGSDFFQGLNKEHKPKSTQGRWPANIILDEEAGAILDEMSGITKRTNCERKNKDFKSVAKAYETAHSTFGHKDSGGASRFFYCAKASSRERNEALDTPCTHPTVKPIALMQYIIKLLAPPGDPVLLDPFAGSGSTLVAAKKLGIRCIGIEKEKEYCDIAEARIYHASNLFSQ